jgi:hypothetical protein
VAATSARALARACSAVALRLRARLRRGGAARLAGLLGGALAAGSATTADAADLPEDRADAMYHLYTGGGVVAQGPAVLVRKNIAELVSLSASYYVDMVSNASIDVVTQASKYKERRAEHSFGLDYAYRESTMSLSTSRSKEPDYVADAVNLDVAQEVFGGLTTVALGYTRGWDSVGKHNTPSFQAGANHWQYRLGLTQILTPRWLMSANFEAISDQGYLQSPYRAARVFGAQVPERDPSTRSSRALTLRAVGDIGNRSAVHATYRYFWDTWAIRAHTLEFGGSRYLGDRWLADAYLRYYDQKRALFYADNFTTATTYASRNRQLGTFNTVSLGAKAAYTAYKVPTKYDVKLNAQLEVMQFKYKDFTDVRTGKLYSFDAGVLEMFVSASF